MKSCSATCFNLCRPSDLSIMRNHSLPFFLAQRSMQNIDVASLLRWYVMMEIPDPTYAQRFLSTYEILEDYIVKFKHEGRKDENGVKMWQSLLRQTEFIAQLCRIMNDVKTVHGTRGKIERLRQLLTDIFSDITYFEEVTMLNPLYFCSAYFLLIVEMFSSRSPILSSKFEL